MADLDRLDIRNSIDCISLDSLHPRSHHAPRLRIYSGGLAQYTVDHCTPRFCQPFQRLLRKVASLLRSDHGSGEHRRNRHRMLGALALAADEQPARRIHAVLKQHRLELGRNSFHDKAPVLDPGDTRIRLPRTHVYVTAKHEATMMC